MYLKNDISLRAGKGKPREALGMINFRIL